jgi:hypothetical protein
MIGTSIFFGQDICVCRKENPRKSAVMSSIASEGELYAALMMIRLNAGPESAGDKAADRLRRSLGKRVKQAKSVEMLKGDQKGIWGLFRRHDRSVMDMSSWREDRKNLMCPGSQNRGRSGAKLAGGRNKPDGISFNFHESALAG